MPGPLTPTQQRARHRLQALGTDPDTLDHEQMRQAWESARAAYIQAAQAGVHMDRLHLDDDPLPGAPLHARMGMLRDAIRDWYGAHPDGWSSPHIRWPGPGEPRDAAGNGA